MTDVNDHYLVPKQEEGLEKNLHHSLLALTIEDAEDMFVEAKERLLDVNNWKKICSDFSGSFMLVDAAGKQLHRHAHKGDLIRIDIPGPGTISGDDYDWVHIDAIEYDDYPDENIETLAVRIRPSTAPDSKDHTTVHFFNDAVTTTLVIERIGKKLTVLYHVRNETANTNNNIIDTTANIAATAGNSLSLSDTHWENLIVGILDFNEE